MQVIKDLLGNYVKIEHGRLSKTTDINKAHTFANGKAQRYIDTQIKKSERDTYLVETISITDNNTKQDIISEKQNITNSFDCISIVSSINEKVHKELSPLYKKLTKKLQKCDDDILDFRHYMRDEKTVLNAVQLCKASKVCQDLERKRLKIKKEAIRCRMVLDMADGLVKQAEDFDFEVYKPRGNVNFAAMIKG